MSVDDVFISLPQYIGQSTAQMSTTAVLFQSHWILFWDTIFDLSAIDTVGHH